MKTIALTLVIAIYLIFAILGTIKVSKSLILTSRQKKLNIILMWLIPVLWYVIILTILKRTPGSAYFEKKNDVSSNNFFESGKGAPGAGLRER